MADPASERPVDSTCRHRSWCWPGLVFALLGGQVVLMCVAVFLATRDRSFAVEPDYYSKSLHWDEQAAQARANQTLGWKIQLDISDIVSTLGRRSFTATIVDRAGKPLDGATALITLFHHARAQDRAEISLTPMGEGRYHADLLLKRAGVWEFRFVVRRGKDVFTAVECRDIAPPRGGSR